MTFKRAYYLASLAAIVGISAPAAAQQSNIAGGWSGSGVVTLPSGNSESVRCRARFTQSGNSASMDASCANASTRVNQTAQLTRISGNRFAGEFFNAQYGITGSIQITVRGSAMSASLSGGGGTATFSLSR